MFLFALPSCKHNQTILKNKEFSQILLQPLSLKDVYAFESKLSSENYIKNGEHVKVLDDKMKLSGVFISKSLYPFVDDYKKLSYHSFQRLKNDFKINSSSEYFFNEENNTLKYCTVQWNFTIGIDWSSIKTIDSYNEMFKADYKNKKRYVDVFNFVKSSINKEYGNPKKSIEGVKESIKEIYIWKKDKVFVKLIYEYSNNDIKPYNKVSYVIYWS